MSLEGQQVLKSRAAIHDRRTPVELTARCHHVFNSEKQNLKQPFCAGISQDQPVDDDDDFKECQHFKKVFI